MKNLQEITSFNIFKMKKTKALLLKDPSNMVYKNIYSKDIKFDGDILIAGDIIIKGNIDITGDIFCFHSMDRLAIYLDHVVSLLMVMLIKMMVIL